MAIPKVYADFQNADSVGRVRLNCVGTTRDLERQHIQLVPGMSLLLYSDDADAQNQPSEIQAIATAEYAAAEKCWVAVIDWSNVRHVAATIDGMSNGVPVDSAARVK